MGTPQAQKVLQAARRHDVDNLRALLRETSASVQDPDTLSSPLHQAVLGAQKRLEDALLSPEPGVSADRDVEERKASIIEAAQKTMRLLLEKGAIWNDLDKNDETPGCLALRLELNDLYDIMVDAGVRAEMLLNRLDEYEALSDDDDDDVEASPSAVDGEKGDSVEVPKLGEAHGASETAPSTSGGNVVEKDLESESYLKSSLRFQGDRLLDSSDNGVMMQWETELMQRHADLLCPQAGLRVLNIGFGMGIIDEAFQGKNPSAHHIIEAHPTVLEQMKSKGWHEKSHVTVHEGRWQDVIPKLLEQATLFDAIFFDTFAEDYKEFRNFFSDNLFGLLDDTGRWGFFNGLGADRQISYDVYDKVVEMDLFEAGFDVDWASVQIPDMGEDVWKGVKRKYWSLKRYSLPTCTFTNH